MYDPGLEPVLGKVLLELETVMDQSFGFENKLYVK